MPSAVIRVIREQGLGHLMNDGELLMVLQHHQIPTRLIDVCRDPLPALFFATEGDDSQDGRMFMIGQRVDPVTGQHPKLILGGYSDLPWSGAAQRKHSSDNGVVKHSGVSPTRLWIHV